LPVPLEDELVAESLPEPTFGEDSPGPAVVPVWPAGAVLAPPVAEPVVPADEPDEVPARASRMQLSRCAPVMLSQRRCSALGSFGALGSPADCVVGTPPVGPVPTALAPDWARIILSLSADACAARGRANAPASATTSNLFSFIAVSCLNK
jgi:hypothetical protein